MILQQFPAAKIEGKKAAGATSEFEIFVNGKKVHSKLGGDGYMTEANKAEVLAKIMKA